MPRATSSLSQYLPAAGDKDVGGLTASGRLNNIDKDEQSLAKEKGYWQLKGYQKPVLDFEEMALYEPVLVRSRTATALDGYLLRNWQSDQFSL